MRTYLAVVASLLAITSSTLAQEPLGGLKPFTEAAPAAAEPVKPAEVAPAAQPPAVMMPETADCRSGDRFWASAAYLLWWIKGNPLPPLMTQGGSGLIGTAQTNVVLGGRTLDANERAGARFTVGGYLDDDETWAVEGRYFFLGRRFNARSVFSNGASPADILFIPYVDPRLTPPVPAVFQVYAPPGGGFGYGSVSVSTFVQGAETNAVHTLYNDCGVHLGVLAGCRYMQLREKLTFNEINGAPGLAELFRTSDEFKTDNQFYGGQLGFQAGWARGRFFALATGKIALGDMQESVNTFGFTTGTATTGLGINGTVPGGAFAQGTNFGNHTHSDLSIIPEVTLNTGVSIGRHIILFVGYNFLYADNVLRPGNQIDTQVNPTQYPGNSTTFSPNPPGPGFVLTNTGIVTAPPPRPAVLFNKSDFWAQGINLGLEFCY